MSRRQDRTNAQIHLLKYYLFIHRSFEVSIRIQIIPRETIAESPIKKKITSKIENRSRSITVLAHGSVYGAALFLASQTHAAHSAQRWESARGCIEIRDRFRIVLYGAGIASNSAAPFISIHTKSSRDSEIPGYCATHVRGPPFSQGVGARRPASRQRR